VGHLSRYPIYKGKLSKDFNQVGLGRGFAMHPAIHCAGLGHTQWLKFISKLASPWSRPLHYARSAPCVPCAPQQCISAGSGLEGIKGVPQDNLKHTLGRG
jgi:hypothetical protein